MTYLAHIDGAREQTVQAHCRNAAEYAAAALRPVQLACLAALAGLLHDMGKFKEAYRLYLRLAAAGDPAAVRGSVNHTFAAVRFLLQRYHTPGGDPVRNLTAELLACAVGAHHGLFDCIDDRRRCGFLHRLEQTDIDYEESLANYLAQCAPLEELDALFAQAVTEVGRCMEKLQPLVQDEYGVESDFYLGLLMRLLLSAVIEGDRRDTAEFMNHMTYPAFPDGEARAAMWDTVLARVERKLGELSCDTDIARARRRISEQCRDIRRTTGRRLSFKRADRRRKNAQFPALRADAREDMEQIPHYFYIAAAEHSGAERTDHPQICRRRPARPRAPLQRHAHK